MPDTIEAIVAVPDENTQNETGEKLLSAVTQSEITALFAKLKGAIDEAGAVIDGIIDFRVQPNIYSGEPAAEPRLIAGPAPIAVPRIATAETDPKPVIALIASNFAPDQTLVRGSDSQPALALSFKFPNPFEKVESIGKKVEETVELEAERKKLHEIIANQTMSDEERKTLLSKIEQFTIEGKQQGLSEHEIAKTLKELGLLIAPTEAALPLADRVTLAIQALEHCINPENIDQGNHNTCNVTSMEEHMYSKNPSAALAVLVQVATNGYYIAPDGKKIVVDPASLRPDREAARGMVDGSRDYASQLLQLVMLNNYYQRLNPPQFLRSVPPDNFAHTGDVIVDQNGNVIEEFPGLTVGAMRQIGEQMFGDSSYIVDGRQFKNTKDMEAYLQKMKQQGNWPAAVIVWGCHVVSVRDYNPATGKYTLSNQWGDSEDFELTPEELLEYFRNIPAKYRQA